MIFYISMTAKNKENLICMVFYKFLRLSITCRLENCLVELQVQLDPSATLGTGSIELMSALLADRSGQA